MMFLTLKAPLAILVTSVYTAFDQRSNYAEFEGNRAKFYTRPSVSFNLGRREAKKTQNSTRQRETRRLSFSEVAPIPLFF